MSPQADYKQTAFNNCNIADSKKYKLALAFKQELWPGYCEDNVGQGRTVRNNRGEAAQTLHRLHISLSQKPPVS